MGFNGGGGAQLTNHVHDNTPLQGGPLNFNNTTIAGMSQGDITYSDGNALQVLAAPGVPAGEVLTFPAAATAPSWQAAGGGGPIAILDSGTGLTGIDTGALTSFDDYEVIRMIMFFNNDIVQPARIRCYDHTSTLQTALYQCSGFSNNTNFTSGNQPQFEITNSVNMPAEGVSIFLNFVNRRSGGYGFGGFGSFSCDQNGGTFSMINQNLAGGTGRCIRGVQLMQPSTISDASYVVYGLLA